MAGVWEYKIVKSKSRSQINLFLPICNWVNDFSSNGKLCLPGTSSSSSSWLVGLWIIHPRRGLSDTRYRGHVTSSFTRRRRNRDTRWHWRRTRMSSLMREILSIFWPLFGLYMVPFFSSATPFIPYLHVNRSKPNSVPRWLPMNESVEGDRSGFVLQKSGNSPSNKDF